MIDCAKNKLDSLHIDHLYNLNHLVCSDNKIPLVETRIDPKYILADPWTKIIFLDPCTIELKRKIEKLKTIQDIEEKIPICSICRSLILYPVKNVVGSYIQTYCKECFIRWFMIEKQSKDPNTGIFVLTMMKEDALFNNLYSKQIENLYEEYF